LSTRCDYGLCRRTTELGGFDDGNKLDVAAGHSDLFGTIEERASFGRATDDASEGATLTKQGEPGREFMIITAGTARVDIDASTVAHLGPGDFLGELAVISGTPRTATVSATSEMTVEVLNRREFMSLLDQSAGLGRKILVGAVKRLQMNERTKTN